eukprot:6216632-Pyramimonas_sp.AAC.2
MLKNVRNGWTRLPQKLSNTHRYVAVSSNHKVVPLCIPCEAKDCPPKIYRLQMVPFVGPHQDSPV